MDIQRSRETWAAVCKSIPSGHENDLDGWHGFWYNGFDDEIMCPDENSASVLADFFEDCGFSCVHWHAYNNPDECYGNEDCLGWWSVYLDG